MISGLILLPTAMAPNVRIGKSQLITERFYLLAEYPFLGRSRPDLREDLRSFPVGNYVIIYKIDAVDVTILHVFPALRDIANLI